MSQQSLRAAQCAAIVRMLELNREPGDERSWQDPWKVLIYDAFCRDIISPLLKVGDLRKRGITLHLLLESDREQISDVPAVYFFQPTRANVQRLGDDCARGLYKAYYVNLNPSIPRVLLEDLATATLESDSSSLVAKVMDQHLNFACTEEDFFTLMMGGSYARLNDPRVADTQVEAALEQIVGGLFSVLATLSVVPVLRYSRGGAAQMVCEQASCARHRVST